MAKNVQNVVVRRRHLSSSFTDKILCPKVYRTVKWNFVKNRKRTMIFFLFMLCFGFCVFGSKTFGLTLAWQMQTKKLEKKNNKEKQMRLFVMVGHNESTSKSKYRRKHKKFIFYTSEFSFDTLSIVPPIIILAVNYTLYFKAKASILFIWYLIQI